MAPPQQLRLKTSNCSLLVIYRPRKDEKLSWPGWLIYSGWSAHISGHPSATGRAQDSESTPVKDRRYTAGPRKPLVPKCLGTEVSWVQSVRLHLDSVVTGFLYVSVQHCIISNA